MTLSLVEKVSGVRNLAEGVVDKVREFSWKASFAFDNKCDEYGSLSMAGIEHRAKQVKRLVCDPVGVWNENKEWIKEESKERGAQVYAFGGVFTLIRTFNEMGLPRILDSANINYLDLHSMSAEQCLASRGSNLLILPFAKDIMKQRNNWFEKVWKMRADSSVAREIGATISFSCIMQLGLYAPSIILPALARGEMDITSLHDWYQMGMKVATNLIIQTPLMTALVFPTYDITMKEYGFKIPKRNKHMWGPKLYSLMGSSVKLQKEAPYIRLERKPASA